MSKSSRNSIARNTNRPARRARRGTAAVEPTAVESSAVEAAAPAAPAPAPSHDEVAQLAFHYFADSGYSDGQALAHWLRAESELSSK